MVLDERKYLVSVEPEQQDGYMDPEARRQAAELRREEAERFRRSAEDIRDQAEYLRTVAEDAPASAESNRQAAQWKTVIEDIGIKME